MREPKEVEGARMDNDPKAPVEKKPGLVAQGIPQTLPGGKI